MRGAIFIGLFLLLGFLMPYSTYAGILPAQERVGVTFPCLCMGPMTWAETIIGIRPAFLTTFWIPRPLGPVPVGDPPPLPGLQTGGDYYPGGVCVVLIPVPPFCVPILTLGTRWFPSQEGVSIGP